MAEMKVNNARRQMAVRHRGRTSQVWIYLGKQLRMFVYQNDWKVLPMSALIAGLVGMVIRNRLFVNKEGTLMGCFAMVMVCIWNGCFNSIQVICRERDVIKRQHRSGMHISSYILSHMLYQLLLCALQTGITMYVTKTVGVQYGKIAPLFTPWFIVDFGISMLLITYASDLMSLWISTIAHTTTTAMTIMPFVLIFQLVFSGGLLTLPGWTRPLTYFTISNPAVKVLCAQSNYNGQNVDTIWKTLKGMRDTEVGGSFTVGQALDLLADADNPAVAEIRDYTLGGVFTLSQISEWMDGSEAAQALLKEHVMEESSVRDLLTFIAKDDAMQEVRDTDFGIPGVSLGKLISDALESEKLQPLLDHSVTRDVTVGDLVDRVKASGIYEKYRDLELGGTVTVGELADRASASSEVQALRGRTISLKVTLGKVFDLIGEDRLSKTIGEMAGRAGFNKDYEYTQDAVISYWLTLGLFILAFALLSTVTLEFIDKDKR